MVTYQRVRGILEREGLPVGHWHRGKVTTRFYGVYEVKAWLNGSALIKVHYSRVSGQVMHGREELERVLGKYGLVVDPVGDGRQYIIKEGDE
jgi:hypothetical protein